MLVLPDSSCLSRSVDSIFDDSFKERRKLKGPLPKIPPKPNMQQVCIQYSLIFFHVYSHRRYRRLEHKVL